MESSNHEHFPNKNQTPHISAEKNNIIDTRQQKEEGSIFSSQKSRMDYVTLDGIENRIGIKKEYDMHLF
jgi:hypothetical protein